VEDYTENVRKNKPKTTKPQSEKSKLTPALFLRVCLGTENCLAALWTDILLFLTSM
jgi:hypothetical protein